MPAPSRLTIGSKRRVAFAQADDMQLASVNGRRAGVAPYAGQVLIEALLSGES